MGQSLVLVPKQTASGRPRLTPLAQEAVAVARAALLREAEAVGLKVLNPTIITEAVCRAYLEAARAHKHRATPYSPHTKAIAAMQPGEEIVLQSTTRNGVSSRFDVARDILGNPEARWVLLTLGGGDVLVRRHEDGAGPLSLRRSALVRELTKMKVGDSLLKPLKRHLNGHYRDSARRFMGEPDAQWTSRATSLGYRVTRVR